MPVFQGTYYTREFLLKNSVDSSAIDVSAWTLHCEVRASLDGDVLLDLTTANGGFVITNGPAGAISMAMTAAQTALLPVGRMLFDVLRTDANPGPVWQFGGRFPVKQPVTR